MSNFFNNKTVLITGAHGFVGKNLVDFLAGTGATLLTPNKQELNLIDQKSTWGYFKNRDIEGRKKEDQFSQKIDELNQETDSLMEEIDKWQM